MENEETCATISEVPCSEMLSSPLPCPFCGDLPRVKNGKVKCVNILCLVQPKIKSWYIPGHNDKAIADWNIRVSR